MSWEKAELDSWGVDFFPIEPSGHPLSLSTASQRAPCIDPAPSEPTPLSSRPGDAVPSITRTGGIESGHGSCRGTIFSWLAQEKG
jgi:hypothetical protein